MEYLALGSEKYPFLKWNFRFILICKQNRKKILGKYNKLLESPILKKQRQLFFIFLSMLFLS